MQRVENKYKVIKLPEYRSGGQATDQDLGADFRAFLDQQIRPVAFIQAYEMGKAFALQGIEYGQFLVKCGKETVATAVVRYYPRYKVFKEAWVSHGPVFKAGLSAEDQASVCSALRDHLLSEKGLIAVQMTPYYWYEEAEALIPAMLDRGFIDLGRDLDMTCVNHIFVKDFSGYEDIEEIIADYDGNTRRAIPKADDYGVVCSDLGLEELDHFFRILDDTADRKEFFIQDKGYFRAMKLAFADRCKFMVSQLDIEQFRRFHEEELAVLEQDLIELEGNQTRRAERQRKELKVKINASKQRLSEADEYPPSGMIDLSALFCLDYGREITTVFGGRYQRFNAVRANVILNHQLLAQAFAQGHDRFNFYGTMEIEEAKQGFGNYEFKKGFGGQARVLVGKFRAERKLARILARLKN